MHADDKLVFGSEGLCRPARRDVCRANAVRPGLSSVQWAVKEPSRGFSWGSGQQRGGVILGNSALELTLAELTAGGFGKAISCAWAQAQISKAAHANRHASMQRRNVKVMGRREVVVLTVWGVIMPFFASADRSSQDHVRSCSLKEQALLQRTPLLKRWLHLRRERAHLASRCAVSPTPRARYHLGTAKVVRR